MSDGTDTQKKQKAAKVRRKPEHESILRPTFAAARHSTNETLWDRGQQGSGLLQRQCACGMHTIGGVKCDTCRRKRESSTLQRTASSDTDELSATNEVQNFQPSNLCCDFSQVPVLNFMSVSQPAPFAIPKSTISVEEKSKDNKLRSKTLPAPDLIRDNISPFTLDMPQKNLSIPVSNNNSDSIQRRIRIATVGRDRTNAAPRIPEFINRLNQINPTAIRYRVDNDRLACDIVNEGQLTNFDTDMRRFIRSNRVIPFRFVNRDPTLDDDSYDLATVDIDDLLAASDTSFELLLLHILTERFETRNYERRRQDFDRTHRLGRIRERDHLRELLGDNTIRYTGERARGASRYVWTFRSDNGYRMEHFFQDNRDGSRRSSDVFVITGGERMTIQEFMNRQQQQP